MNSLTYQPATSRHFTQLPPNANNNQPVASNCPAYNILAQTTLKTVSIATVQQYLDRCIERGVCLFAYCIAMDVVYRIAA
jgi:hypothetical protein